MRKVSEKTLMLENCILRLFFLNGKAVDEGAATDLFLRCGDSVTMWVKGNSFFEEQWAGNYWQESVLLQRNSIVMMISNEFNKWGTNLKILPMLAERQSSPKRVLSSRNLLWMWSHTLHISVSYQGKKGEITNVRRLVRGVTDGDLQRSNLRKEQEISAPSYPQ